MGTITIDCHHKETDERQDKRGVGGRERAKDYTLVDNHCQLFHQLLNQCLNLPHRH